MARIGSEVKHDAAFEQNANRLRSLLEGLSSKASGVREGGGPEALARHRKRGKLTARERIEKLIDPGSCFLEIGLFCAWGMYEEHGGAPAAGTIIGIGSIHGRDTVIVANDATVKAGAWFPITCKKTSGRRR